MNPDRRYYFLIVTEKDLGDETIYAHVNKLIAKAKIKYPQTVLNSTNIVIPNNYVDSHYSFLFNGQIIHKKGYISETLKQLTNRSELVIHGHGDVDQNRINGVSAPVLAVGLTSLGLRANCRVNITGCDLGRNAQIGGAARAAATASELGSRSFAQTFQYELYRNAGLCCQVHARTSWVVVRDDGSKNTVLFNANPSPAAVPFTDMAAKQPKSKIIFDINAAGAQTMTYAY